MRDLVWSLEVGTASRRTARRALLPTQYLLRRKDMGSLLCCLGSGVTCIGGTQFHGHGGLMTRTSLW